MNINEGTNAMRMKLRLAALICFWLVTAVSSTKAAQTQASGSSIESKFSTVDGIKIHYLVAGHGPTVILVHGYTQTSRMWRPLIPKLTDRFTVVAPDLPGIGESEIAKDGLDMKTAAIRIHKLATSLGVTKARVVGHDIGLMVAYAYAAQFPAEVDKLVVMDAFLPGIPGWELAYDSPNFWHFRFHGPTPEALVRGREQIYFAYFWNDLAADKNRSLSEADRVAYVAAYSRAGRMRAGWEYFATWPETAKQFAQMAQTQLTMPVLSIAGDKGSAPILGPQMKRVATNVKVIELKDTGHWLMEERPNETMDALVAFL
ncbi:MAG TPA: alpha/beta hydrolase [Candidatus Saccharimonadales bacterium]|nr:alpha/beta hydrolase [Candidatus Saccharimonadales bacterium]